MSTATKWSWDKVVRSSHFVNCWSQAHCAWDVFVKDGLVWREEQAADYPRVRPDVPDYNPRGCQKRRRIKFYIDDPYYIELGETLPVHKDPPKSGGDYPLMLTGGHTRWSIHSAWRDDARMLRLQRGRPVMYISVPDAQARGINDGDLVQVRNDIDSFRIDAKVSPALRPGQLIVYHAWENFQFPDGKGFQNLIPSPINPVELAGGEGHLRPIQIGMQPSQNDRDTRVEVTRVAA